MELLALTGLLWRRKRVVLGAVCFFLAVAVAAQAVLPQSYTAETEVLVTSEESTSALLNELDLSEISMSLNGDDLQNKIYLATSAPVVDDMIWKLQLRNGDGEIYTAEDVADGGVLSTALGTPSVSVSQVSGTDVLVIEAIGPSAEAARLMADTLAATYVEHTTRRKREELAQAQAFIRDQLGLVTGELDLAFARISEAQQQDEVIDLESEVRAAVGRLSELLLEQETTAAKIQDLQARVAATRSFRAEEASKGVSATSMTTNPVIGTLRTRISDLRTKRDALVMDNYTSLSPEVRAYDFQIEAAEAELRAALGEMAGLDPVVAQYEAELAGLRHKGLEITAGIERTTNAFASYPEKMRRISQLELAATAAEGVYRSLQDQRFQIGIAEAMTMSDVRVVAPALLPDKPSHPKLLLDLLAGLILGVAFGLGTALLVEHVDDSVKSADAVREVWPLPQLGLVPKYAVRPRPALATLPPTDPLAEAHRTIRNAIAYASLDKPLRLLAVTSCLPGEGKSTLAVNLALSMASEGKRVLLVDADLRRPRQHLWFEGVTPRPGLVELVSGATSAAEAVRSTPVERLHLVPAGALPPDPAQIVESLRLRHVLAELSRGYDVVLVDTPPVLVVSDALAIGRMVDRTLVVAEPHVVTRKMLAEARARFEAARVDALGIVLSKVRFGHGAYGYYGSYAAADKERGVA